MISSSNHRREATSLRKSNSRLPWVNTARSRFACSSESSSKLRISLSARHVRTERQNMPAMLATSSAAVPTQPAANTPSSHSGLEKSRSQTPPVATMTLSSTLGGALSIFSSQPLSGRDIHRPAVTRSRSSAISSSLVDESPLPDPSRNSAAILYAVAWPMPRCLAA